jgi:hypothetical protein
LGIPGEIMPHPINIDLTKLAPDVFKLIVDIIKALGKKSDGGVKITAAEWLEIGHSSGFVLRDIVDDLTHKE